MYIVMLLLFWGNLAKEKIVSWTSVPSDMVHLHSGASSFLTPESQQDVD